MKRARDPWQMAPLAALLVAALAAVPAGLGQEDNPRPLFEDEVLARGENLRITESELERTYIAYKANLAAQGRSIPADRRTEVEKQLLERLIFTRILVRQATPEEKARGQQQAEQRLERRRAEAFSSEAFVGQIRSLGLTPEEFRQQLVDQAIAEQVIERRITDRLTVSDEEAREYYESHPELFRYPERVRASHILISTHDPESQGRLNPESRKEMRRLAEKVREAARSGTDFETLVQRYSDDPRADDNNGEYTFERGQTAPEFESAVFSMEPGQISDVVRTRYGFHIIKLHEVLPSKSADFQEVAEDIKSRIREQKTKERLPEYREKLKKEAGVEIVGSLE